MKVLSRINKVIFPDSQKVTEDIILHYEKNPDELDLIINKEYFNTIYLGIIFVLGIGTTLLARVIQFLYSDTLGEFISDVVLDVISELGIAIFGGAVVAYLIESLNKQQFQQNIRFRREIKAILEERKKTRK